MKYIGRLASVVILIFNALFIGGLLFAAYSPSINPVEHPVRACMGLTFPIFLIVNICFLIFWLIFNFKFAAFSLIAMLICIVQIRIYIPINITSGKVPENSIKVLSYNVMGFADYDKSTGKSEILEYIRNSNADIICMQEYIIPNSKNLSQAAIEKLLKDYPYHHVELFNGNGMAFYSKYPITSAKRVKYESSYNGSMLYEIKIGDDKFTVINNHLESNKLTQEDRKLFENIVTDPETSKVKSGAKYLVGKLAEAMVIRSQQANIIAGEIANTSNPYIIVCGDFNDSPISYTHKTISHDLDDAFVKSGNGLGTSYNQNKFYFRIDNILISKNLKAYKCKVDRSIRKSDHYPIWCYLAKKENS